MTGYDDSASEGHGPGSVPQHALLELILLAVRGTVARCRIVGTDGSIVFRSSETWRLVPGQIVSIRPRRFWRFGRHAYVSGDVVATRVDIWMLGLKPLELHCRGMWDPAEEYWGEEGDPLEAWFLPIMAAGRRPQFETEQVLPDWDLDDPFSDPIVQSVELREMGDTEGADRLLNDLLLADLRCLDGHAHLGNLVFDWDEEQALRHYEVGVRIGELSLGPDFEGVLPWGWIDNRPFLRCLHGYGLCLWRAGRFDEAREVFERLLWLDPEDNLGVRGLIGPVLEQLPWEPDP